jgi:hypothetical protein
MSKNQDRKVAKPRDTWLFGCNLCRKLPARRCEAGTHDVSPTKNKFDGSLIDLHSWHHRRKFMYELQRGEERAISLVEKYHLAVYENQLNIFQTLADLHSFLREDVFDNGLELWVLSNNLGLYTALHRVLYLRSTGHVLLDGELFEHWSAEMTD